MAGPGDKLAARLLDGALERGWEGRVALREGDRTWTYAQLADQAARMATVLRTLRVSRGERVALLMRDTLDAAAAANPTARRVATTPWLLMAPPLVGSGSLPTVALRGVAEVVK